MLVVLLVMLAFQQAVLVLDNFNLLQVTQSTQKVPIKYPKWVLPVTRGNLR